MKEKKEESELVWALKRFVIRGLTIIAAITQLIFTLIFSLSGEVKIGISCALAAIVIIYYFIDLVKKEG